MSTYSAHPVPTLPKTVAVGPRLRRQGNDVHIVHDMQAERYFQVTPKEEFILSRLNGERTFGEIEREFAAQFGSRLNEQSWAQFFGQLNTPTMFAVLDKSATAQGESARSLKRDTQRRKTNSLFHYRFPLLDPTSLIDRTIRSCPWIVSAKRLWLLFTLVLVMLVGAAFSITTEWNHYLDLMATAPWTVVIAYAVVFPTLALHEFAHGLVCVAVGGKSPEMGVAWRFPLFTVYTRTENIYLVRRARDRVLVAAAGVLAGLLGMLPVFAVHLVIRPGTPAGDIILATLVIGMFLHLVNLVPFIGLDGQKILSHSLNVWDIAQESRQYFISLAKRRPYPSLQGRPTLVIPIYGIVTGCLLTLFSIWGIWSLITFLNPFLGGWKTLAALVCAACISTTFFLLTRRSSQEYS